MTESGNADVLVASNRGPLTFIRSEAGTLEVRRGGGGLVSGLTAATTAGEAGNAVWVCAALSEGDRAAAAAVPDGRLDRGPLAGVSDLCPVRMLDLDPDTFHRAYNSVANSTLWFVHHLLYETPVKPVFDEDFAVDWDAYVAYNAAFADALAAEAAPDARVLIQDYHLALAPQLLRRARPDLRIGHFSHTPWAPPDYFALLPDTVAAEVLAGMLGADRAGFLTRRWALAFLDCCERSLGAVVDRDELTVRYHGRTTRVGVHALGVDGDALCERAYRADVDERLAVLRGAVGDRKVIVRVDRTELSKNIVRGLLGYAELLRRRPEWRGRVVHVAFAYPSRSDVPEYQEYQEAVMRTAAELRAEFATEEWDPLVLHVEDDYPRSLAAYRLADVALVNPIRDGMNLVAKEIPIVAAAGDGDGCALVLSREAGAFAELGEDAVVINPYDITATARALHEALTLPPDDRRKRSDRLAAAATALPPQRWFTDQLAAL